MLIGCAKRLIGISLKAWEHPADKAALGALRQLRGLDEILKMVVGGTTERSIRLLHVASCVKVTATQFHRVKMMLDRVVEVMDWPSTLDAFVVNRLLRNRMRAMILS